MQTNFTPEQLRDPDTARSNQVLRNCVHCGFCTATCPTYQLLGDERDSPRGRIYLIKDMLENGRKPDAQTVKHIDRCLSCLSCMSTCPSGVHYMHLVDHARAYIEEHYDRPFTDRALRAILSWVLPYPARFRVAIRLGQIGRVFAPLLPGRLRQMTEFVPKSLPPAENLPVLNPAKGQRVKKIVLMTGCAQKTLAPSINAATVRLLQRFGVEVIIPPAQGCCGALSHHMGKAGASHDFALSNIAAWDQIDGLDAVVINTSGCGTTVKDYGHMLRETPAADAAARISELAVDVSELLGLLDLPQLPAQELRVAYHAACSLQHGQQVKTAPKDLLRRAGFTVGEPSEAHLCCGSAGTYNLLQPEIASQLKARKVNNIAALPHDVIVAGNIGCIMQIGSAAEKPILHLAELLDWAYGGPKPPALGG